MINDIPFVLSQIKKSIPIKNKNSTKLLNNLKILLEKNCKENTSETIKANKEKLSNLKEKQHELFLDLCFLRSELVKKVSEEYYEDCKKINNLNDSISNINLEQLENINTNILLESNIENNILPINNDIVDKLDDLKRKLKNIKNVLIEENYDNEMDAYKYVDRYFNK